MDRDHRLEPLRERLSRVSGVRPIGEDEGRRFCRWDLASTVEGAFGRLLDPDRVTEETYWHERLGWSGQGPEDPYTDRYWITDEGRVVGTLGIGTYVVGWGSAHVSSLYVHPAWRTRGLAGRTLDAVYDLGVDGGLQGYRLDTHWTWQKSVRYYLARGLWVSAWRQTLSFTRLRRLPPYAIEVEGGIVAFCVAVDGAMAPLLVAEREGERLVLRETPLHERLCDQDEHWTTLRYGRSTLALRLALEGWPLVRSGEDRGAAVEQGDPEGLAHQIEIFERAARDKGWVVDTPILTN